VDLGRPGHVEVLFKRSPRGRKPKDPVQRGVQDRDRPQTTTA
jgi:hypothetical protein